MHLATILLLLEPAPFAGTSELAPEQAVEYALAHNPRVEAARRRADGLRAAVDMHGWWPEPKLTVSGSPLPIETRNGPAWASASLMQPLPWTGELDAKTATADAQARAAVQALQLVELQLAREVRHACFARWRTQAELDINGRNANIVRRFVERAQGRLAVGATGQADVLLAQVELARLDNDAIDLQQALVTRAAALNTLLARPPTEALPPAQAPRPRATEAVDALMKWSAEKHPSLRRHTALIDATRARVRAADYAGHPRMWAGVGYTFVQASDAPASETNGRDAVMVSFGTTIPLWGGRYGAAETAAREQVAAAGQARDAAEDLQAFRVLEQHTHVETALRRVRLFETAVLPLAKQTLEVLEEAYGAGRGGFLELLRAERALERFQLQHARALAGFEMRLADLAFAVGRPVTGAEETADDAE